MSHLIRTWYYPRTKPYRVQILIGKTKQKQTLIFTPNKLDNQNEDLKTYLNGI